MFFGREPELERLEKLYESNQFECVIVYGRRRVGKTTLIKEFCKDKKSVYFVAIESTIQSNLGNLSSSIFSVIMPDIEGTPTFERLETALEHLYSITSKERLIFVIDEYPYLAGADRSVSSILQAFIDQKFKNSKMMLILCGSSMSFMENQVLGYQSPLYGRRTAQLRVNPFDYLTASRFCERYSNYEKAIVYGITGGVPQYLERIDPQLTLIENIVTRFLDPSGYFFEEPSNLLKQELREPQIYNAVITAIANGASRLNEIATAVGIETGVCSTYLVSLMSLGIVIKEKPVGEPRSKKSIYRVADSMFRFWYRFVPANINAIVSNRGDLVYDKIVEPKLHEYMGSIFEQMCMEYLNRCNGTSQIPFPFFEMGRWWGNHPKEKLQVEIDIVAADRQNRKALFCECKFRNELMGPAILETLQKNSEMLTGFDNRYYALFSISGFAPELLDAGTDHVRTVSLDNLYEII